MNRRSLIKGAGAVSATALSPRLAQSERIYRIGMLVSAPHDAPHHLALREKLRLSGFADGENLWFDRQGYGLSGDRFEQHAAELVRAGVDVIHAGGEAAVRAAQKATGEIPILALTDDMLGQGFVQSLSKPGGNTTGVTILASELDVKRQEILIGTVPELHSIGALADDNTNKPEHLQALQAAARAKGLELSIRHVGNAGEIAPAINAAHASGVQALNVLASALFFNNRSIIFERTAALRLPAIYQWPEMAHQSGLIGYGPSIVQLYRDVISRQLIAILRGAKPADQPVEQPTTFELVVNLKTAIAIGLAIPQSIVLRADEIVE